MMIFNLLETNSQNKITGLSSLAILIQGIIDDQLSHTTLKQLKKVFPTVKIYYASYEKKDILDKYGVTYIQIYDPGVSVFKNNNQIDKNNSLRMLFNIPYVLNFIEEDFILKIRFDTLILNNRFIDYYINNNVIQKESSKFNFKIGVVRFIDCQFNKHYYIDDFVQLGFKKDLYKLYSDAIKFYELNSKLITSPTISPEKFLWSHNYSDDFCILKENRTKYESFITDYILTIFDNKSIRLLKYPNEFMNFKSYISFKYHGFNNSLLIKAIKFIKMIIRSFNHVY